MTEWYERVDWDFGYDCINKDFFCASDSSVGFMEGEEVAEVLNKLRFENYNLKNGKDVPRFNRDEKLSTIIRFLKLLEDTEYSITISHIADVLIWFVSKFYYNDILIKRWVGIGHINKFEFKALSEYGERILNFINVETYEHDVLSYLIATKSFDSLFEDTESIKNQSKRTPISNALRVQILDRDDYKCQMCGATVKDGATLHIDHIVPVSKGGTDNPDNLQVLCSDCNHGKYNKDYLKHDKRKLKELKSNKN